MKKINLFLIALVFGAISCQDKSRQAIDTQDQTETLMENDDTKNDWTVLFNGEDLDNWKAYNAEEITQWKIEGDALVFIPTKGEGSGSENLITKDTYTNFELSMEWKISEGGNSGVMWGVQEGDQFDEPYVTGPEIQILDNQGHPDAKNGPIRQAGALYDLSEPTEDVTNPPGEWNEMVIRIDYEDNRGTVTLNGTQITGFPLRGEEWEELVQNSKFSDWEDFGQHRTGHIALQDHGDRVSFRNIRIRELH